MIPLPTFCIIQCRLQLPEFNLDSERSGKAKTNGGPASVFTGWFYLSAEEGSDLSLLTRRHVFDPCRNGHVFWILLTFHQGPSGLMNLTGGLDLQLHT